MDSENVAEIKRHFSVVAEGLEVQSRQVAEGLIGLDERLDRRISTLEENMNRQFEETRAMIRLSYAELERRLSGPLRPDSRTWSLAWSASKPAEDR